MKIILKLGFIAIFFLAFTTGKSQEKPVEMRTDKSLIDISQDKKVKKQEIKPGKKKIAKKEVKKGGSTEMAINEKGKAADSTNKTKGTTTNPAVKIEKSDTPQRSE